MSKTPTQEHYDFCESLWLQMCWHGSGYAAYEILTRDENIKADYIAKLQKANATIDHQCQELRELTEQLNFYKLRDFKNLLQGPDHNE